MLKLEKTVLNFYNAKSVELVDFSTPGAIEKFNKLKNQEKKLAAVITYIQIHTYFSGFSYDILKWFTILLYEVHLIDTIKSNDYSD